MATNFSPKTDRAGFALLITLLVVGSVLSIGAVLLDTTIKQVRLASTAKDSEVSFHAANAGMECARYIRRAERAAMATGGDINPECFGGMSDPVSVPGDELVGNNDGEAFLYEYQFSWGPTDERRCSVIKTIVASSSPAASDDLVVPDVRDEIPGYPDPSNEKTCAPGSVCTLVSVQGYNRACGEITGYGTIEREVLLQF